ncbi:uncharacterized protein LOC143008304 [Genypterus blacodes]|uniref:uncharacterized protein LOC143008304 n=1 Tax=Genypterus blacodes TaxID=154954 RepID=UPI003F7592C5
MEAHLSGLQVLQALRSLLHAQSQQLLGLHAAHTGIHQQRLRARRQLILQRLRRRRSPVVWSLPRSHHWWDSVVTEFTSAQFIQSFRVSRESFDYICRSVRPVLEKRNTNYRLCVPVRKRVAIALWKLATSSEYRSVSELFGVGISTVFNCVQDFCSAVIRVLLPVHVAFPGAGRLEEMENLFESRWKLPQCVGALDRIHVPIITPQENSMDYLNTDGWNSIVLQGAVDGRGLFWDVSVGCPGSVPDDGVLAQSDLWERLSDGELLSLSRRDICGREVGRYLIGDQGYRLRPWLLTPFTNSDDLTPERRRYNAGIRAATGVAEAAFRRLRGRWRCLLERNDSKLELTKRTAMTCCVLHNICEEHGDEFSQEEREEREEVQTPAQGSPEHGGAGGDEDGGADIRAALVDHINEQTE